MEEASEFLLTKDYKDNWLSEMHERFCFWSFSEWKTALEEAGFAVDSRSSVFTNPWIMENRFMGKASLYSEDLAPLSYPPTQYDHHSPETSVALLRGVDHGNMDNSVLLLYFADGPETEVLINFPCERG